jgi:hypothetical protein
VPSPLESVPGAAQPKLNVRKTLDTTEIRFKPTALEGGTIIVTMHRETHCSLISPGNDRCPTKCENQYFINF